jgi:hypothetical protein
MCKRLVDRDANFKMFLVNSSKLYGLEDVCAEDHCMKAQYYMGCFSEENKLTALSITKDAARIPSSPARTSLTARRIRIGLLIMDEDGYLRHSVG